MIENIFLSYLKMSVSVSIPAIALLLLSPLLNKRYAAKWKYRVWLVLAVRLVLPVQIALPVQVVLPFGPAGANVEKAESAGVEEAKANAAEATESGANAKKAREVKTGAAKTGGIEARTESMDILAGKGALEQNAFHENIKAYKTGQGQEEKQGTLQKLISIWLAGCIIFLAVHLSSYLYFKKRVLEKAAVSECGYEEMALLKKQMHLRKQIAIVQLDKVASPMAAGFFHPVIILPGTEYSKKEMHFILEHELVHISRHDIYGKLLFIIANALHWFNPFVYLMRREAVSDMELSCDERVIQGASGRVRKAYTETLLALVQPAGASAFTMQYYGGVNMMKKRFQNILLYGGKKKKGVLLLAGMTMFAIVAGCTQKTDIGNSQDRRSGQAASSQKQPEGEYSKGKEGAGKADYGKISEVFAGVESACKKEYAKLILKGEYPINQPDVCGSWKFQVVEDFDKNGREFIKEYVGKAFDKKYYKEHPLSNGRVTIPKGPEYHDRANGIYAGVGENGFFVYEMTDKLGGYQAVGQMLLVNGYQDAAYELEDGSMKISEALARAQEYADHWTNQSSDFQYRPYRLVISKNPDGKYMYEVQMQKIYGNSFLFESLQYSQKQEIGRGIRRSGINIDINTKKGAARIYNEAVFTCRSQLEENTKIVTLESALELASNIFFRSYPRSVSSISFENILFPAGEAEQNLGIIAGKEFVSHPYWIIYFNTEENQEEYVAVDAVTGQVTYISNGMESRYSEINPEYWDVEFRERVIESMHG